MKGLAEPGLILTPPEKGTKIDDGFLTASEVALLKLYPGLVILSACNTASSDGTPGAKSAKSRDRTSRGYPSSRHGIIRLSENHR